ncbi:MAG TPA: hypothetical protein VII31_01635 [Caldimonas sp.]
MTGSLPPWKLGAATLVFALYGCGVGDPPAPQTYSIGGTVSGLSGVAVLQNNLGDDLTISANGNFAFATALTSGSAYSITVKTQPSSPTQTCVVGNATGSVAGAAVTTATVTCTTNTYVVNGTITGLAGSGLVVQDNGGDDIALSSSAVGFGFGTPVASGATYNVTVKTQPTGPAQTCIVAAGSGTVGSVAVTVAVTCTTNTAFVCGVTENGTVVTHAADITADEAWAGAGTVHLVTAPIAIVARATVTVQPCAIVKLSGGTGIDVRGDLATGAIAKLVSAGDDFVTGRVVFETANASGPAWGRLRGVNKNSIIELNNTAISGGGNVGGSQLNAVVSMNGSSVLPDATLKVVTVVIDAPAGAGIYLSDAAFTSDSNFVVVQNGTDSAIAMSAMALGSIPPNTVFNNATVQASEIRVVENSNIFDNLTISTSQPIHFKTDGVHVGGLAPTFVQNVTLTLHAGVTLKFEGLTGPPMVVFGDQGQTTDKNAALVVQGTPGVPVRFTSGAATPAPGDWAGLWLATSNGSQIDNAIIEFAGGDAHVGPQSCGPFDPSIAQRARNTAALLVGDGTDQQYVPPAGLLTNTTFRNNTGSYAIDAVWEAPAFGPSLVASNTFGSGPKFCTQNKNLKPLGCFVGGVDQSGCLVP